MLRYLRPLTLLLLLATLFPSAVSAIPAADWDVAGGHFFGQTGYVVRDSADGRFWSDFRRLGGVDALGYPVSQPYLSGGLRYQAFQRAILQWRPELGQSLLANTFDWLTEAGKDTWLDSLGIPAPLADRGANWAQVIAERESWLTEPAIARAYQAGGGMDRFGLPQSRPERRGPFIVQRFQRIAFQYWVEWADNMPAPGSVVGILAGDLIKQAGLIPAMALVADEPGGPVAEVAGTEVERLARAESSTAEVSAEQLALTLINQSRREHGLTPVSMDGAIQQVARAHAQDMASRSFFAHVNPDGLHSYDRLRAAGIRYGTMGENLGWGKGYRTPTDSVRANHEMMMAETPPDDGHRRVILNGRYAKIGIGVAVAADGKVYYAAEFTD